MKIKVLVVDMDGTAVSYPNEPFHSSWDALAGVLPTDTKQKWFGIRDYYLEKGDPFYDEWFEKQVSFLRGIKLQEVEKILFPPPYSPGFVNFFKSVNGQYKKGILSSGLELVAERIYKDLSFDFFSANPLEIYKGVFTGRGTNKIALLSKKGELEKISRSHKFDLKEVCFVGDSFNDIPVLECVGLPIAFEPKSEEVASAAKYSISNFKELKNILKNEY